MKSKKHFQNVIPVTTLLLIVFKSFILALLFVLKFVNYFSIPLLAK